MELEEVYLQKLHAVSFKNFAELDLEFSPHVNCFVGPNGAGKTNVLDAIYYLSFCKSYFNAVDAQNIQHANPFFVIQGVYQKSDKHEEIYCGLKRGQKKQFKRNKKLYDKFADHIGEIPLVMITPYDIDLIYEGSETRRKFMDGIISQYNKKYLEVLLQYNKILTQRNATLKTMAKSGFFDTTLLSVYNEQLIELAPFLHQSRVTFLNDFELLFNQYYHLISGEAEEVSLTHKAHLTDDNMENCLNSVLEADRFKQYTSKGPHKDDLVFTIGQRPLKKFGSQGQQKSFLIALKLAQFEFIKQQTHKRPLLLLDDIFDKIDESRAKNLMNIVGELPFGQLFITDTHPNRVKELFDEKNTEIKLFKVSQGVI